MRRFPLHRREDEELWFNMNPGLSNSKRICRLALHSNCYNNLFYVSTFRKKNLQCTLGSLTKFLNKTWTAENMFYQLRLVWIKTRFFLFCLVFCLSKKKVCCPQQVKLIFQSWYDMNAASAKLQWDEKTCGYPREGAATDVHTSIYLQHNFPSWIKLAICVQVRIEQWRL